MRELGYTSIGGTAGNTDQPVPAAEHTSIERKIAALRDFNLRRCGLPKSAGVPVSSVPPRSASRAFILGSARPALISRFSLSMISAGVFLGAPTPRGEVA